MTEDGSIDTAALSGGSISPPTSRFGVGILYWWGQLGSTSESALFLFRRNGFAALWLLDTTAAGTTGGSNDTATIHR